MNKNLKGITLLYTNNQCERSYHYYFTWREQFLSQGSLSSFPPTSKAGPAQGLPVAINPDAYLAITAEEERAPHHLVLHPDIKPLEKIMSQRQQRRRRKRK